MYRQKDKYVAEIKVYHKNDWVWMEVPLRKSDVDYLIRNKAHAKEFAPTIERRFKNWELRFAYETKVMLSERIDTIISVDLGRNTDAVVTAIRQDGTVIGRKFINHPREKDQMDTLLNQIKRNQQKGSYKNKKLWAFANNKNQSITEKTAKAITDYAVLYNADVVVFEYLNLQGKVKGSKRQKLALWRKRGVQTLVMTKAHRLGIRISRINPWGTSKYAFDGSGEVIRGELQPSGRKNYQNCVFSTGKEYNCDLNASYNIGARYYIREILKSLPEMDRLSIEAKVPQLLKRTTCVLADLINLNVAIGAIRIKS